MPTVVRPSVSALRDWLRTVPGVVAVAAQRVYIGPMPQAAPLPAVVVTRIGGGIADLPLDGVGVQLDCWAQTGVAAEALAAAVCRAVLSTLPETTMGDGLTWMGGTITSITWLPDPRDGTPRYVVRANLTMRMS